MHLACVQSQLVLLVCNTHVEPRIGNHAKVSIVRLLCFPVYFALFNIFL
jgi:hypothetical protein